MTEIDSSDESWVKNDQVSVESAKQIGQNSEKKCSFLMGQTKEAMSNQSILLYYHIF